MDFPLPGYTRTTHSWDLSGRGTTGAADAQGTPAQSHTSPRILLYEDYKKNAFEVRGVAGVARGGDGGAGGRVRATRHAPGDGMSLERGRLIRLRVGEGYHKSRRSSRDTYPESHSTKHTSIQEMPLKCAVWQTSQEAARKGG